MAKKDAGREVADVDVAVVVIRLARDVGWGGLETPTVFEGEASAVEGGAVGGEDRLVQAAVLQLEVSEDGGEHGVVGVSH